MEADLPSIRAIYNDAVARTTTTFDTEPRSEEAQLTWWHAHGPRHPVLVAEVAGKVVGWASMNLYSDRKAYERTGEFSMYVDEPHRGRGIGRALLRDTLAAGERAGLHTVLSRITEGNETSLRMHEAEGFTWMGTLREAGVKFGKVLDVHFLQRRLGAAEKTETRVLGAGHVQISVPRERETEAREFYLEFLGLTELPKPEALRARGGFWARAGAIELHAGLEDSPDATEHLRAIKAHVAWEVRGLANWTQRLAERGIIAKPGTPIPGMDRMEFRDPFGNRVELFERA